MINPTKNTIKFGNGDVCIYLSVEPGCGRLVLRNQQKRKIGVYRKAKPSEATLAVRPDDVVMNFSNPESIDAVITSLQKIKKYAFQNEK